jgi:hypothetical protein
MTLEEIIAKKLSNLDLVPDELISNYEKRQRVILKDLLKIVQSLDYDDSGNLKQTKANYNRINLLSKQAERNLLNDKGIVDSVKSFSKSMDAQRTLNKSMFQMAIRNFTDKQIFETAYKNSKTIVLDNLKSSGINSAFTEPLRVLLNDNVSTKASYSKLVDGLTDFVMGEDNKDPLLIRHVKQVAWDGYANTDAAYSNTIANSLGVDWFRYSGARLKDSRHFCDERKKGIFHRGEVEAWGRGISTGNLEFPKGGEWQGKAKDTNEFTIWIKRGGYRCVDAYIPIDVLDVPKDVIQRVRNEGFI